MCDECGCSAPGPMAHDAENIQVNHSILSNNDTHAAENRSYFHENGILCINLISSPGSGKTTLMEKTASILKDKYNLAFLIGDLETERDADRIRNQGVPAFQLTTAGACHLEAPLVRKGYDILEKENGKPDILFIENVGNLVCPTSYALGEEIRVVLVSSPEGDDKPAKYPTAFRTSHLFGITKVDVAEHFDFDIAKIRKEALSLNPYLDVMELSSKTGDGIDEWIQYITDKVEHLKAHVSGGHNH